MCAHAVRPSRLPSRLIYPKRMGIADRLLRLSKRAQGEAATHKDAVPTALAKAEKLSDQKTGGKYHDQIVKTGHKADAYVDDLQPSDPTMAPGPRPVDGSDRPR